MKIFLLLIYITIISGCSIFKPEETNPTEPQLLKQSALPPIPESLFYESFEFYCEMLIREDGSVERARLLKGSGDVVWDSLAAISLLDWKFSPALSDGKPMKVLVRRKVSVVFSESEKILLAEALFKTSSEADSAYIALLNGEDFVRIVMKYSISPSKDKYGFLGKVDIQFYSRDISRALARLSENEFTKPLPYGEHYIIFMRLSER